MADYSDPQAEAALRAVSQMQGLNRWLGVELIAAGNGEAEIMLKAKPEIQQHHGFIHGGIVASLGDTACAWAAATAVGDVVTASYTVQFLAPAKGDRLIAKGTTIKAGKRTVSVEARVYSESDGEDHKLVATALAQIARV